MTEIAFVITLALWIVLWVYFIAVIRNTNKRINDILKKIEEDLEE